MSVSKVVGERVAMIEDDLLAHLIGEDLANNPDPNVTVGEVVDHLADLDWEDIKDKNPEEAMLWIKGHLKDLIPRATDPPQY